MFPEPQNSPPKREEPFSCHLVPLDVARNLGAPIVHVGARLDVMDGTAVPETPVDIDGNLLFGEDDVGLTAPISLVGSVVDSVPEPGAKEKSSDGTLRCRVTATVGFHRLLRDVA